MSKLSTITIYVNLNCTKFKFYWFRGFPFLSAIQNVNTPNEVKIAKTLTFNSRYMYDQQSCLETNMFKDMTYKLCLFHIH